MLFWDLFSISARHNMSSTVMSALSELALCLQPAVSVVASPKSLGLLQFCQLAQWNLGIIPGHIMLNLLWWYWAVTRYSGIWAELQVHYSNSTQHTLMIIVGAARNDWKINSAFLSDMSELDVPAPTCRFPIIHTSVGGISQSPKRTDRAIKAPLQRGKPCSSSCITVPWWNLSVSVQLVFLHLAQKCRRGCFLKVFPRPVFLFGNMLLEPYPFWCRSSWCIITHRAEHWHSNLCKTARLKPDRGQKMHEDVMNARNYRVRAEPGAGYYLVLR